MARLRVTQTRLAQHVELTVTRVTRHAQLPARLTRPESLAVARRPTVHHFPQPSSLAAAPVTRSSPPSTAAAGRHRPHLPRAVTVVTRSGPPSLAAARLNRHCPVTCSSQSHSDGAAARLRSPQPARLTDSVTRSCSSAKAEVYAVVQIWNTLIAMLGKP